MVCSYHGYLYHFKRNTFEINNFQKNYHKNIAYKLKLLETNFKVTLVTLKFFIIYEICIKYFKI